MTRPQYRLRVDELRIFYDIGVGEVQVLAIVSKEQADDWLAESGQPADEETNERDR